MISWDTFKSAAAEYSRIKPRRVYESFVPVPGSKTQTVPDNTIGVEYFGLGLEAEVFEVTQTGTNAVWAFSDGTLYINPAPTDDTPIDVVWLQTHQPVETIDPDTGLLTGSFPTIPAQDIPTIEKLELAKDLETQANSMARNGPLMYMVGQSQVDRTDNVEGLRRESRRLRREAIGELSDVLGAMR